MAVSISMNILQNSQSIERNTSNVTVDVYAHWTNGSYNAQTAPDGYPSARGTVTIGGTPYAFYSKFNTGHTTSGNEKIFSKTLDISHNDEGEKILSCSASYDTKVGSGTVSTSGSKLLTPIPRKSVLNVSNGTLGTAQTLNVSRKSTLLTHTITYSCGEEAGTICEKSENTSVSWTPPLALAAQYPNSNSVPAALTITTYNGNKEVGAYSVTITCAIPKSVVPTVDIDVSDYSGYLSKYGAYVQGKSKLRIIATASGARGSTIKTYKTEIDGKSYTKASITTEVLNGTGNLTVKTTVTDSRGRTATDSRTISVLAYSDPNISALSVSRCNANGKASSSGAYLAVRFHADITALNSKNGAAYTVKYKKSREAYYTTKTLSAYTGNYTVSGGVFIFSAETASSYDVIVTAKDDFTSAQKSGVGSSIKKTWSVLKNGLGFAFGKISEVANCLDMGWFIKMNGNKITELGTPTNAEDAVNLYYVQKNYRPNTWLPTASEIGAAPAGNYAPGGYGLGVEMPNSVSDLNVVKKVGWYITNPTTKNIPSGWGYAVLLVERRGSVIYQTLKSADGFVNLRKIERYSEDTGTTWSAWKECFSMDLLWENASPKSAFAAQILYFSLSEYTLVMIESAEGSTFCKVGKNTVMFSHNSYYPCRRTVTVYSDGISFGEGLKYMECPGDSVASDKNQVCIPRTIYGIKGVT